MICIVTHDPRFAAHAERQVHLFDGKIVAEGELNQMASICLLRTPIRSRW